LVDLGNLSDHDRCCGLACRYLGEVVGVALAVVGDEDITIDEKDSVRSWHLHDEVGVMWDGHELGQHRSTEDGMVGGVEICDLIRQVLRAEVVLFAESHRQTYTTYGVCSLAEYDPVEGLVTRGHLGEVEFHLLQCFGEDDVQAAAPIDEGLR
jgi:hypothetical protein